MIPANVPQQVATRTTTTRLAPAAWPTCEAHRTTMSTPTSTPSPAVRTLTALLAFLCPALPLTATADESPLSRVEITGSRLPVTGAGEGMAPLQVVTRHELQQSGAQTLRDRLDGLAAGGGGSNETGTSASFAAGASSASLRSLGVQATLVLLNGRRLAPYPLADYASVFTNLDSLPFEAIERIEVYKAGGAAVYGSDAVAGVINVITRSDFRGVQTRLIHERSLNNDRHRSSHAALAGGFDLPGSQAGRLLASAEFHQRDGLVWREVLDDVRPEWFEQSAGFGTWSSYSWPGNVVGGATIPGCAPEHQRNGLCMYDRYERFEVLPALKRANLLLDARLPLDGGRELFSEAVLARARTLDALRPGGIGHASWSGNALGPNRLRGETQQQDCGCGYCCGECIAGECHARTLAHGGPIPRGHCVTAHRLAHVAGRVHAGELHHRAQRRCLTQPFTRPCAKASRSKALMRVCQPEPDALNASTRSESRRSVI